MTEHQNIEFKSSWQDDYLKWICGFANAQGGRIYIGKDDNGKTAGIKIKLEIKRQQYTNYSADKWRIWRESGV